MKLQIILGLTLFALVSCLRAQERYVSLKLVDGRMVTNAQLDSVSSSSLVLARGGKSVRVPLDEIRQVRFINEPSIVQGAAIGAGIGLAVGGVVGFAVPSSEDGSRSRATSVMLFGILGGIAGSVSGFLGSSGDAVDLSKMSMTEKKEAIEKLLRQKSD